MLNFHSWLNKPFDEKTQFKVKELRKNPSELKDAFNKNIEFGTGGMRGVMGVGTNRINKYTSDLKLKRTNPIKKNNTLESCMNLKCI